MNLGIIGNGVIVRKMLEDIQLIGGVAARSICVREISLEKGRELAERYILSVYTDINDFLKQDDIDTIYIGIVNNEHYPYAKLALEAGKHVICEKPFTVNSTELQNLIDIAKENKLFLWEAIRILYSPVFLAVKKNLLNLGEIKLVQSNISRVSSRYREYQKGNVLPTFNQELAGGCLYDINVYNLHFVIGLFGKPTKIHYFANRGYNGIDTSGTVILEFDGFHAVLSAAKDSNCEPFGLIQGTEGYICVHGAISAASSAELITETKRISIGADEENYMLASEMREFERQYRGEDYDQCYRTLDHSLVVMKVLETALENTRIRSL